MVYTGGEEDTRFFSRVPKSPALAALWRRRRQKKKPTTPSIRATPRRPPIIPPTTTPVLLLPATVGLLVGCAVDCPVSMDPPVSVCCEGEGVLDGVGVGAIAEVLATERVLGVLKAGASEVLVVMEVLEHKRSPRAHMGALAPTSSRCTRVSMAPVKGIDNAQRTPQSAAEKNEIGRIFKERLYRPVVSKCS